MGVKSQRQLVEERLAEAIPLALRGAAQIYRRAMMESLANAPIGGYTTGRYSHGVAGVAGSVVVSPVEQDESGHRIVVGSRLPYAKYWELGFHRRLWVWYDEKKDRWYSRPGPTKYERVERWRPVLDREAPAMIERFWKLVRGYMR